MLIIDWRELHIVCCKDVDRKCHRTEVSIVCFFLPTPNPVKLIFVFIYTHDIIPITVMVMVKSKFYISSYIDFGKAYIWKAHTNDLCKRDIGEER